MINFKEPYNHEDFIQLLNTLLPDFKEEKEGIQISRCFKHIKLVSKIGVSKSLGLKVYEIEHESEHDPRVALSRESFLLMKDFAVRKALVIFKNQKSHNYRLSLITFESKWESGSKIKMSFSNPRRYSFFLGPDAKVKTPTKLLIVKGKMVDFDDLKNRFSIEVVNKEFYNEISKAFTSLVNGKLKLPDRIDISKENLEFAVRMIGRIIFCWFLREKVSNAGKSLMPEDLLSLDAVVGHKDYYHKILEPIFFEVLNRPIKSRNLDFSNSLFSSIPYLNGGLFSPQDDDFYKRTRDDLQSQYHDTLLIPDEWFKEFFEILETYNFTIDENTSYDEELSIDPEMLGRIFENLLAEINPETGESARKSTGSYYTPRVIVNYMVDESLLLYLKNKTNIDEKKLKAIISYDLSDDTTNPISNDEKEKIIDALEKVKILDPACGSGAFPMGALQKIVFILQQTDPDGQLWFKKQIKNTTPEVRRVVEREFEHKNFDYIRKLGIIRENIYGVDIQAIATEISRLRCFLTLVVDERIQDEEENRGIEPLPNLDFKFVTANSLIGLPKIDLNQQSMFDDYQKIDELKQIRDQYFNASGIEREQLKTEFVMQQKSLVDQLIKEHGFMGIAKAELTQKLTNWEPFRHKPTSWFDPEWMFGIKKGFDIVMANPPYLRVQELPQKDKVIYKKIFVSANGAYDLYLLFTEKGFSLLNETGTLCHIMPDKWINGALGAGLRKITAKHISKLISFKQHQVFNASTYSSLIWIRKPSQHELLYTELDRDLQNNYLLESWLSSLGNVNYAVINNESLDEHPWIFSNTKAHGVLQKILSQPNKMTDVFEKIFQGIATSKDSVYFLNDCVEKEEVVLGYSDALNEQVEIERGFVKPLLMGEDVHRYIKLLTTRNVIFPYNILQKDGSKKVSSIDPEFIKHNFPKAWKYLHACEDLIKGREKGKLKDEIDWYRYIYPKNITLFDKPKLVCPYISNRSQFSFDERGEFYTNTKVYGFIKKESSNFDYKFLLAVMNSKVTWFYMTNVSAVFRGGYYVYAPIYINNFSIPNLTIEKQKPLISLVNKILDIKSQNYSESTQTLETQIDQMVYELYGLTHEEIEIIENG